MGTKAVPIAILDLLTYSNLLILIGGQLGGRAAADFPDLAEDSPTILQRFSNFNIPVYLGKSSCRSPLFVGTGLKDANEVVLQDSNNFAEWLTPWHCW